MTGLIYLVSIAIFCWVCYWYTKNHDVSFTGKTSGFFDMYDELAIHEAQQNEKIVTDLRRARRLGKKALEIYLEKFPNALELEAAAKAEKKKKK